MERTDAWRNRARRGVAMATGALLMIAACSSGNEVSDSAASQPSNTQPQSATQPSSATEPSSVTHSPAGTQPSLVTQPPSGTQPSSATRLAFPVAASENKRYLLDQEGKPWMMNGDSPQCMTGNLAVDDMEFFLADRAEHGFNAVWVNLLCGPYTFGRKDASTFDGIPPFTDGTNFDTPNPPYWQRMDTMVDLAKKYGITLLLDPAETGSFADWAKDNGVEKSRAYGQFLGKRYHDDVNIIWMLGNDYGEWAKYDEYEIALSKGIRDADPAKLQTIELNPPTSTSFSDDVWPPLIDLNAAYSYTPTYDIVRRGYKEEPTMPVFMVEANYEFENNDGGPPTTDEVLRRQEWWTMTSGATGQLYGNKYTWGLQNSDWKKHFDTPAVSQYGLMASFFGERRWWDLVPDLKNEILSKGQGEASDAGDVFDNTYATAAATADGSLAVVYIPTARTIEIDESKLAPGVRARWYDPTNGAYRDAEAPFVTPGTNAAGSQDWVLVFEQPTG
jgi:Protein of unknown function (DUF4038)/Putative collagen-binding domain of a collagenase